MLLVSTLLLAHVGHDHDLVAGADGDLLVALVALDEAAPVELAVAALDALLLARGEAAVAAHEVAPVQALAQLQANNKRVT